MFLFGGGVLDWARKSLTEQVTMCKNQQGQKEPVIVRVTMAVIKYNDQKQLGEWEGFI